MANQSLRNRAAGTDVATTNGGDDIKSAIRKMEDQFRLAMPKGAEATQLVRDALTALQTTRNLDKCDPKTILGALMTCAQLGLRPGVLGHAWVLPFYDKHSKTHKAQLIIGYQGLVDLAHRSDRIASLIARTVHEHDVFEVSYGLDDSLIHKPYLDGDRGDAVAYYAIVKIKGGGHAFVVMSKREAEVHRDRFAMARKQDGTIVGPWRDNFDEMAMKTCVIKLAKWMPKSTELQSAIVADEGIRADYAPGGDVAHATYHPKGDDDVIDGQVVTLRDRVHEAAEKVGMSEPDYLDNFAAQNDGLSMDDATDEQMEKFVEWLGQQKTAKA